MADVVPLASQRCPECHARMAGAALEFGICTGCGWDAELAAPERDGRLDRAARFAVEGRTEERRA